MTKTKADVVDAETVETTSDGTEPAPEDLKAFLIDLYSLELSMREQGHSLFSLFAKGAHDAYGIMPIATVFVTEPVPTVYIEAKQNPTNKV